MLDSMSEVRFHERYDNIEGAGAVGHKTLLMRRIHVCLVGQLS